MENLKIDLSKIFGFVDKSTVDALQEKAENSNMALYNKTLPGNDFLGWVNVTNLNTADHIKRISEIASEFKSKIDILVVIGIGGSYLGSKAVIEALSNSFESLSKKRKNPVVVFAGQNIGEDYTNELVEILNDYSYALCVISKSGTTTEPALAFRILKQHIENKYGKSEAAQRIIAVTDAAKGALRKLAAEEGYRTFVIQDDVGGRYSVLTPVGLLPIAVAGFDISQLIRGAIDMETLTNSTAKIENNPAAIYAQARNVLYNSGFKTEILVNYHPKLQYLSEWWKQLFGESEGKENKGIFPASVNFTADLHSMGQYIQEGQRTIFETVISVKNQNTNRTVPNDEANLDGLNFLTGKRIDEVNKMAELGTLLAHVDGGVPNIRIEIPFLNEYYIGQLLYFFEKSCGISGYILGVNPFDQPGVEAYKKNMFALLGKPGFEKEADELRKRI